MIGKPYTCVTLLTEHNVGISTLSGGCEGMKIIVSVFRRDKIGYEDTPAYSNALSTDNNCKDTLKYDESDDTTV